jgi:hypothetical protein
VAAKIILLTANGLGANAVIRGTGRTWLNAVEGFFAKLTKRWVQRGVFLSLVDLQAAINRFLVKPNDHPKPFVWTADPDKIIAAVRRGYQTLDSID